MSLEFDELINQYAHSIRNNPRVRNKAIILCEGTVDILRATIKNNRLSPGLFRRLENNPDASFYSACLPKAYQKRHRPQFFNCGGRSDVFQLFNKLRELDKDSTDDSYLDIQKLFVLVDLDIQPATLEYYDFPDTEAIFNDLYNGTDINISKLKHHQIFTTGLIHKEAYFLLPELEQVFVNYINPIFYKAEQLNLSHLYTDIVDDFSRVDDENGLGLNELSENFSLVKNRLHRLGFEVDNIEDLKNTFYQWLNDEHSQLEQLVQALFLVRKIKPYWEQIKIADLGRKDHLILEIADYYSKKDDNTFHLTAILKSIYQRYY